MANTCGHCSRVNPPGAEYCYFDGISLNRQGGPQNIGSQAFPSPFVFPSGRACRSFDQLARACQDEWAAAVEMLRGGFLERFLGGLGRMDLALAARTAAAFPDADRGLDQLLERLPTQALQPPRLQVEPTEINLGTLRPDTDHHFELHLANQGTRLLYGAIVSDARWLTFGDGPGNPRKLFQCSTEMVIPVTVHARQLRAGNKPMEARLVVESNGGTVTVRVKALVPAKPFTGGVLAGALTPRQLAEKAREDPRAAALFFENGSVAAWYQENGWTYPVQGPPATGLAAVQQFFEALGLAKPPKIELSEPMLSLRGRPGEALRQALQVRTSEKRPVYAGAASDQAWLGIGPVQMNGPTALIPLEVARVPDQPGQMLQARVLVTANGGQRFVVPVSLAIGAAGPTHAASVPTPMPVETAVSPAIPQRARPLPPPHTPVHKHVRSTADEKTDPDGNNAKLYIILGGVLLLFLLIGGVALLVIGPGSAGSDAGGSGKVAVRVQDEPADDKKPDKNNVPVPVATAKIDDEPDEDNSPKVAPVKFKIDDEPEERLKNVPPAPVKVAIKDEPEEVQPGGKVVNAPVDLTQRIIYQYGQTLRFGITALMDADGRPLNKRLTYSPDGNTSNTRIKVDGYDLDYSEQLNRGKNLARWVQQNKRIANNPALQSRSGTLSVLAVGNVHISQIVEVVPSKQPVMVNGAPRRLLDTVLVRYVIENRDSRAHRVGLRAHVDTLIGSNDGVPFTVPGLPGLVNTMHDFRTTKQVPPFIQALEFPNLQSPGTVALMTLKLGGGLEPPSRVSLTHWPGPTAPWTVPMEYMRNDSAVIIYWNEKLLQPGKKRTFGYAYGLGRVDAGEAGGKLGITLNGEFDPGKAFTVTALINNPVPKQTVTLTVPQGLQILDPPTVAVPRAQGNPPTSVVTWNVKVLQTGEFRVRVASSTGQAQSKTLTIARPDGPTGGKLALELQGRSFEPGQVFTVLAKVTEPVAGQKLTLELPPRGLEKVEGAATQDVPRPEGGPQGTSTVTWQLRIATTGRFPVRVVSSTGVAQTKTLTIEQQDVSGGRFRVGLDGDFAPGKYFRVTAYVADPVPGQTLTLKLPAGLERVRCAERQNVPPAPKGGSSQVVWTVLVQRAGKFRLGVASSTGITQWKALTIESVVADAGRFVFNLAGEIKPGKVFYVVAKVTSPVKGQTLTLKLPPAQLERIEGAETQPVVAQTSAMGEVRWAVRVLAQQGELSVRVASSTGLTKGKRITLKQSQSQDGIFD